MISATASVIAIKWLTRQAFALDTITAAVLAVQLLSLYLSSDVMTPSLLPSSMPTVDLLLQLLLIWFVTSITYGIVESK